MRGLIQRVSQAIWLLSLLLVSSGPTAAIHAACLIHKQW